MLAKHLSSERLKCAHPVVIQHLCSLCLSMVIHGDFRIGIITLFSGSTKRGFGG